MLKKISFFFLIGFCAIAAVLFFYNKKSSSDYIVHKKKKEVYHWQKFSKRNDTITQGKADTSDLIKHLVEEKRSPAAIKQVSKINKRPMRDGRFLEGKNIKKYTDPKYALRISKKINPKWEKLLGHNLTRFQPEGTEVLVKKEHGLIYIKNDNAEYREQVLISYKSVSGDKNSFRAMIDPSNGKIIYTFDRTIKENFRKKASGLSHPLLQ